MKNLKSDWLTEGLIDFEYKKYILLAYLKGVRHNFSLNRLYPFLSDLIFHFRNLHRIQSNKMMIYEQFPGTISKADFEKLQVSYKKIVEDNDIMKEISDIIEFSMGQFKDLLEEGKDIYEFVEENIELVPIGVSPLYDREGYLLVEELKNTELEVYRYQVTIFESADEKYQGVHTRLIDTFEKSMSTTYEYVKLMLVKRYKDLPNPATYLLTAKFTFPHQATLLPVAKRLLVKYINGTGNTER
ncbi:MAG TPA: hypothetical protein VI583_03200 [Cyclobacteriaceae bacterium]|nr:hypothetical protein [Cyclobacteriaceae bacterium]